MKKRRLHSVEERLKFLNLWRESGLNKTDFCKSHGFTHQCLNIWIKQYGSLTAEEIVKMKTEAKMSADVSELQEEIRKLQKEKKSLEKQLKREELRSKAFSTLIDLAESTYKIRVRKNFDAK